MLKAVQFTNFKSWSKADMACGRITGIFGANSSGKTSLLQFLLLMKQTKDATDRANSLELNGPLVKLGTIKDVMHYHDEEKSIEIGLSFNLDRMHSFFYPSKKKSRQPMIGKNLKLSAAVSVFDKKLVTHQLSYQFANQIFELSSTSKNKMQFELKSRTVDGTPTGFAFIRTPGRAWKLPGPIKTYAFPDQARMYFQNAGFLADLEATYEGELDRLFYLGPLREFPQRDYLWARSRPSDVGQRGEKTIDAILAATEAKEMRNLKSKSRNMPFQKMIAYWLRELGLIESFSVTEIAVGSNRWQARVRTRAGASDVLLTDVGFGVSQVLPVITLLQYVPEGSTVILEQPEIHLHPLAQAGLADVIIQAAVHRKVQVILESHSEHLLLRLQRRIAEQTLSSDDVKLYFCDAPEGVSTLTPLNVDMFGRILNWPDKFMGDAFGEVAEAEMKRIERRARQAAE